MRKKINIEFDQTVDFSQYPTFAIRHGELNSKNPALNSELVKKQIDADIERARYRFGSARKVELEQYRPDRKRRKNRRRQARQYAEAEVKKSTGRSRSRLGNARMPHSEPRP